MAAALKLIMLLGAIFGLIMPSYAMLSIELTQGVLAGLPIAIVPLQVKNSQSNTATSIAAQITEVIGHDLTNSGRFKVYDKSLLRMYPATVNEVSWPYFKQLGVDNIVVGSLQELSKGQYEISLQLLDVFAAPGAKNEDAKHSNTQLKQPTESVVKAKTVVLRKKLSFTAGQVRQAAHQISDLIYQQIFGIKGIFSTRLAYIVVKHLPNGRNTYVLEIADFDGAQPHAILRSTDPLMSPAWSRDGHKIAYVSFEKRRAAIYVQDLLTAKRQLISKLPGINGAPAWSPDGRKLAVVLSMRIAPNIYILDLLSHNLTKITNDNYLNTEPAWAPDGSSVFFTSTRSGGPQIYQYDFATKTINPVTHEGSYNARASLTADGRRLVAIHKEQDAFAIAIFDLDTGAMRILSPAGTHDSSSPSVAPNGSMVLYDTVFQGRNILAMVSTDGRIQLRLPAFSGEAQDPAWSPFLT
jgi:TolB protein